MIQARSFGETHDELTALNAVVVGISTDSVDRSERFGDSLGIPYELGSDATGEVRRLYDVRRRFGLGTSRVTYVIDARGIIRGAFHNEFRVTSHVQYALKTLMKISADPQTASQG